MKLKELVSRSRSCRRFLEDESIPRSTLSKIVDLARLSPSGGNKQPLKYFISCDREVNEAIFPCLSWAGYLKDWKGPEKGRRPAAYIIVLNDSRISSSPGCDHGIAVQSMMLGATEKGLAGCIIGSVDRERLGKAVGIEERYDILLVVALGKAGETVSIEEVGPEGDIRYWRDASGVHHVPKRPLEEVIID